MFLSCLYLLLPVWHTALGLLWHEARKESLILSEAQSWRWPKASEDICLWWVSSCSDVMWGACREIFFLFDMKNILKKLTVFNLISLCRLHHGSTPHEEAETRLTVILLASWRIATCLSDWGWQYDTTIIHNILNRRKFLYWVTYAVIITRMSSVLQ